MNETVSVNLKLVFYLAMLACLSVVPSYCTTVGLSMFQFHPAGMNRLKRATQRL